MTDCFRVSVLHLLAGTVANKPARAVLGFVWGWERHSHSPWAVRSQSPVNLSQCLGTTMSPAIWVHFPFLC